MANSPNFTYSKNLQTSTQDVVMTTCHILINGLMSKGGAMHIVALIEIQCQLEHVLLTIKVISIQNLKHKYFHRRM